MIKSTLEDKEQTTAQSAELSNLTAKASSVVALLNPDDELKFLRIRSKQREILVRNLVLIFDVLIACFCVAVFLTCDETPLTTQGFSRERVHFGRYSKPEPG